MNVLQPVDLYVADCLRNSSTSARDAGPARQLDVQRARLTAPRTAPDAEISTDVATDGGGRGLPWFSRLVARWTDRPATTLRPAGSYR